VLVSVEQVNVNIHQRIADVKKKRHRRVTTKIMEGTTSDEFPQNTCITTLQVRHRLAVQMPVRTRISPSGIVDKLEKLDPRST
jgi:hypothetical protein